MNFKSKVKVRDLQLGDRISLAVDSDWDGYDTATVYRKLENGNCHVMRPYVHVSDFAYSGHPNGTRVIPYLGMEDFELMANSEVIFLKGEPNIR